MLPLCGIAGSPTSVLKNETIVSRTDNNPYEEFNTYALEWSDDEYIIYVNGIEAGRSDFGGISQDEEWLLLSVEVGGVGVGKRNTATKDAPQFQCAYPAYFDSSVRVNGNLYGADGNPVTYDVYSKTEHRVGTWIDGKPLYRKVIEVSSISTDSTSPTSVSFGVTTKVLVSIGGYIKTKNYGNTPVNSYHSAAFRTFTRSDGASKLVSYAGTSYTNNGAVFIIEYTKS